MWAASTTKITIQKETNKITPQQRQTNTIDLANNLRIFIKEAHNSFDLILSTYIKIRQLIRILNILDN